MKLVHCFKKWWYRRIEAQLRTPTTMKRVEADIKYPPPSAYEVQQIDREYGLSKFSSLQRIEPRKTQRLDVNIN
jgi:hypothetical protein